KSASRVRFRANRTLSQYRRMSEFDPERTFIVSMARLVSIQDAHRSDHPKLLAFGPNETLACVSCPSLARQACCTVASKINLVISSGCEISERWLAFTSIVLAPIRLAMKRSRSGLMVRSSVETA